MARPPSRSHSPGRSRPPSRSRSPSPRWWSARRAQNRKPATYRCPICGGHLPALGEHMLLYPEGRSEGRRHAHTRCVHRERAAGRLPTREEWQRTQPRAPSLWQRLWRRLGRRSR